MLVGKVKLGEDRVAYILRRCVQGTAWRDGHLHDEIQVGVSNGKQ